MSRELTLPEEALLLALHDEKGTRAHGSLLGYTLGAAVLAELLLRERIGLEGDGKKAKVVVLDDAPTRSPLLDEALAAIGGGKPRRLTDWVTRLAPGREARETLALQLVRRGVLRTEEKAVLLFFRKKVWPTVDPGPERALIARLRRGALEPDEPVDDRTAVLLGILHATSLLSPVLDRKERKRAEERIESLARDSVAAGAARQAVEAVTAALVAASAATMVTTS